MPNNIPGVPRRVQPGTYVRTRTLNRGAAGPAGQRVLCIIGEGQREEVVVASAEGGGADGVNADFSGSNNPTGRHFTVSQIGLVRGRTQVFKNGAPLNVLEEDIDTDPFDSRYDVRVERATGRLELQQSYLVSVGSGQYWSSPTTNSGNGNPVLTSASLIDTSAPAETWTARVVSVVKDGYGDIISGEATIAVSGSVSGTIKDSDGNPIRWRSDGVVVSNGILSFAFAEGSQPFDVGDRFTILVDSGVLAKNDELEVRYIATLDVEDAELFLDPNALFAKHGDPSVTNTLSLAARLAFENGAPQVLALQAKPPIPRKTSENLLLADNPLTDDVEGASGNADIEDCIFPLDLGARPDADTQVNIFVVNSDGTEEQLVLSKVTFYDSDYSTRSGTYTSFCLGAQSQAYTLVDIPEVEQYHIDDGYVTSTSTTQITFSADSVVFSGDRLDEGETDIGKKIIIQEPASVAGTYTITAIGDGYGDFTVATATLDSGSITSGLNVDNVNWQVVDPADTGVHLALTDDVALNNLTVGKGLRVEYVDVKDADYFDTNWAAALEKLEAEECQIIVPVPTSLKSNIFQGTLTHVESMSSILYGKWRTMIIGALQGLTPDNLIGREEAAVENLGVLEGIQGDDAEEVLAGNIEDLTNYSVTASYGGTYRCIYMCPDELIVNIRGTNTVLPGYYLAACLGGYLAGQGNVAVPATFKNLVGFNLARTKKYRQITLDQLADAGVCVVQPIPGGGRVLHAITTVQSNSAEEEEISIVAIRDATAIVIRNTLQPFIGQVATENTIAQMNLAVSSALASLVSQELLNNFSGVTVVRDSVEPRQYNIGALINPRGSVVWTFADLTVQL